VDTLLEFAQVIAPVAIGALTVPIMNGLKSLVTLIDRAPAWAKRLIAVTIAFGLTKLGALLNVAIPTDITLIDGSTIEAIAAAALAFAFHAGDQNRSDPTRYNGGTRALLLAFLFFTPVAATCQTGRATVTVIDRGNLDVIVTPETYTGEVGDTLTFTAVAVDRTTGDTIPSVFLWESTDTTGVQVDPNTGHATLLSAGTFDITAMVVRIVAMMITTQEDDGSWREVFSSDPERQAVYAARGSAPDSLVLEVGETRPMCAYLVSDQEEYFLPDSVEWSSSDTTVVTVSPGPADQDICPLWDPNFGWVGRALPIRMPAFMRTVQLG
jgi:hypothetical protein